MKQSLYIACILLFSVLLGVWVTNAATVVDTVTVQDRSGNTVIVNRSELDAYLAAGYTIAETGDFLITYPQTGSAMKKIVFGVGDHATTSLTATTKAICGVVDRIVVDANGTDTSFTVTLKDADGVTLWTKADCNSLAMPYSYAVSMADTASNDFSGVPVGGVLTLEASALALVCEVQTLTLNAAATRGSFILTYDGQTTASISEVVQLAQVNDPNGGTFKLTFGGQQTAALDFNSTAAAIDTALEALSTIEPNEVVCTGGPLPGTPVVVTFAGGLGGQDVGAITLSTNALTATDANDTASYAISVTTAGAGLAYGASTATIKAALEALDTVASNDIAVGGGTLASGNPTTFTFRDTWGDVAIRLSIDISNLTGPATTTLVETTKGHSALDVVAAAVYYHELPQ